MEETLCDISAFNLHRTPPQVLALMPTVPAAQTDKTGSRLKRHPLVQHVVGPTIHLMVTDRRKRSSAKCIQSHLASTELPFGCVQTTDLGINVTSPLFTLLQLAQHLSEEHLAMAMYEFCGTFSVFKPSTEIEDLLASAQQAGTLPANSWRRVTGQDGKPTSLWQRSPLISLDELRQFAVATKGMRGNRRFAKAAKTVTGATASPFEAQTSILLAQSRRKGGEGFPAFTNNQRIALSPAASMLANRSTCYADLLFEQHKGKKPLIIECQGRIAHDNTASAVSDANRTVALQHMGYEVVLLSYEQIALADRFDAVKRLLASHLGITYRRKTKNLCKREHDLRRNIFINWETLAA